MGSHTIVPLKLDFAAEKGGMAVSAVWRLVYFLAPLPVGTNKHAKAHALCPSTKIQKQAAFGINVFLAKGTNVQVSASRKKGGDFLSSGFLQWVDLF